MVNYPSLPGLTGFPGHRTFYAKTGTVPRNLGPVDHPNLRTAGSQSFWRPSERLHGTQLRIISMKGKEVEYLSTNLNGWGSLQGIIFQLLPIWPVQGQGMLLCPENAPWKKDTCLWSVCRQTLGSAKGTRAGHQHYLSDTWLFFPNLMGKRMSSMLFSLGFPI